MSDRKRLVLGVNLLLASVALFIGVACLFPVNVTASYEEDVFRRGRHPNGVSLLVNVYWGTEQVYEMLDVLDEYQAKATFFIGGCWADDNVPCVQEIDRRGHEIASHGYFHKDCTSLSAKQLKEEIGTSAAFLCKATGKGVTLFAPPSGAYDEKTAQVCKDLGMGVVLWSKDTVDWRDKEKEICVRRATEGVSGGEFVLMHPMAETVRALPEILQYYRENSLLTVTVSENLTYGG